MIRREGERMIVAGPMTLASVGALLEPGRAQIARGVRTVDLGEVSELDSSALALLVAWLREARARGRDLAFTGLPQGMVAIARLYGVADLLCAPSAAGQQARAH
jgi:phospholipid transport system transporter-binding protein